MLFLTLLALVAMPQRDPDPACSASIRWAVAPQIQSLSRSVQPRTLTAFSTLSRNALGCGPGEIQLTAAFFDANDDLVCSGTTAVAAQDAVTQVTTLELRLASLVDFVRWRNGPRGPAERARPFVCRNAENTADAQSPDLERAVSVRFYLTLVGRYGALATDELRLLLQP